jgi:hypothetical protein
VRFSVDPAQIGELLDAVGGAGVGFTTTVVVAGELAHPLFATTVYVPAAASVTAAIVGFCNVELKLFGPVHEYVAPAIVLAVRFKVDPTQTGLLLDAVGVAGAEFTVAVVVAGALVHPATVTVTEYVPVAAVVAPGIEVF